MSGLRTSFKFPDLEENRYVYDAAARLKAFELVGSPGRTVYYEQDAAGLQTRKILPSNRAIYYYSYDVAGRLTRQTSLDNTGALVTYLAFQRNPLGQAAWVRHEANENSYYEYDALSRMTLWDRRNTTQMIYGFRYSHDAAGNRATKTDLIAARATYHAHDSRNLLTSEFVLQTSATTDLLYDSAQRRTRRFSSTAATYYSFDQRDMVRRLSFEKAGGGAHAPFYFSHNGAGEWVRQRQGTTESYLSWDDEKLVLERLAVGPVLQRYRRNQSPQEDMNAGAVEREDGEGVRHYDVTDEQGNVEVADGGKILRDPDGNILIQDGSDDSRISFLPSHGLVVLVDEAGNVVAVVEPPGSVYETLVRQPTPDNGFAFPFSSPVTEERFLGIPRAATQPPVIVIHDGDLDPRDLDVCCDRTWEGRAFVRFGENVKGAVPGAAMGVMDSLDALWDFGTMQGVQEATRKSIERQINLGDRGICEQLIETHIEGLTNQLSLLGRYMGFTPAAQGLYTTGKGVLQGSPEAAADGVFMVVSFLVLRRCCGGAVAGQTRLTPKFMPGGGGYSAAWELVPYPGRMGKVLDRLGVRRPQVMAATETIEASMATPGLPVQQILSHELAHRAVANHPVLRELAFLATEPQPGQCRLPGLYGPALLSEELLVSLKAGQGLGAPSSAWRSLRASPGATKSLVLGGLGWGGAAGAGGAGLYVTYKK